MATTQNTFTGDGSNLGPFSFTFKWLEPTDIKVTVAGVLKTVGTHYNLQSLNYSTKTGGQVLFTAGNTPANGAAIVIYRQTDDSDLAATFYSGSAIRAQDLNNNFVQGLYVTQESSNNANTATSTANSALTNSNTAIGTANTALSTANTASSNASAAVTTANTASSNASAAVSTANTANSNATNAVNTANAATVTANSAATDAATAISTANGAVSTANAASTAATNAVNTANAASSTASSAVSTANTASTNASNAVTTANTASTNATTAVNTANSATVTANAAAAAVANAVLYTTVANVAAIPATPANNTAVEVTNSTGIESFTPLSGKPVGFVGSSGLSVRIIYQTVGTTWTWIQYFPNDPENRYLKEAGDTMTGALGVTAGTAAAPSVFISGDTNTGIYSPGADQVAISTNGSERFLIGSAGSILSQGGPWNFSRYGGASANLVVNGFDGTQAAPTAVATSRSIGGVQGTAYDGTAGRQIGGISLWAETAPTSTSSPGFISFTTTPSGSTTPTERLRITSAGLVGIGTSNPGYPLDLQSESGGSGLRIRGGSGGSSLIQFTDNAISSQWGAITTTSTSCNIEHSAIVRFGTASTERVRIDSSGRLLVGTSTARSNFFGTTLSAVTQTEGTGGAAGRGALSVINNDVSNNPPYLLLGRSGAATLGSNAAVVSGSRLGTLTFHGADGTSFIEAATVAGEVDGTPGTNDMPGRLVFSTTADGASSPTERMRIAQNGVITIQNGAVAVIGTLTDGATITPDFAADCNFAVTLGGSRTMANPTNITAGQSGSIFISQSTGSHTLSWGSYWDFPGGTPPTLSTAAGAVDRIDYIVRSSTSIHTVFTANYS